MYVCPGCAGNLKFDIARQQLICESCDTQIDPYSFYKETDAEETRYASEEGDYEITVFTCPQCGGELVSEDVTAATFCSFCGGSTILDSRISRERRPQKIIPFTRTKEDCRAAYKKLVGRAVFAPRALKDESLIQQFRGIYMPYWVYSFAKNETVTFPGRVTSRSGDYLITDHYSLECQVEECYQGLAFDGSSTFSDNLSSAIGPFDLGEGKPFVPSFLSGFYADTSDVEQTVYLQDAEDLVVRDAGSILAADPVCKTYQAGQGGDWYGFRTAVCPWDRTVELALLPVWFLSYRNGDRVSYAVVNGQTGKAAADLPVDGKRYLAGSLLLAVPLFFLLNRFFTLTPGKLLLAGVLLACVCLGISNSQLTHMIARESGEDDKGFTFRNRPGGEAPSGWDRTKGNAPVQKSRENSIVEVICMLLLFYCIADLLSYLLYLAGNESMYSVVQILMIILILGATVLRFFDVKKEPRWKRGNAGEKPLGGGHFKEKWPVLRKPLAGIGLAVLILVWHPVSDWFYYLGALGCMGTVLWAILDMIRQHNVLATRKLPQLGRRGGEERG